MGKLLIFNNGMNDLENNLIIGGNKMDITKKSKKLKEQIGKRRSVRKFSKKDVPKKAVKDCINIASSAPSGANMQPWTFVLVSDSKIKSEIRKEAEKVELEFYKEKINEEWSEKLSPLKTNYKKTFLENAPYLICVFMQKYGLDKKGNKITHYYPHQSVGIATGFLISALHQIGLATLTYTPAPMNFLKNILERPENETPYMILPVGYPAEEYSPPDITKKSEDEYLIEYE